MKQSLQRRNRFKAFLKTKLSIITASIIFLIMLAGCSTKSDTSKTQKSDSNSIINVQTDDKSNSQHNETGVTDNSGTGQTQDEIKETINANVTTSNKNNNSSSPKNSQPSDNTKRTPKPTNKPTKDDKPVSQKDKLDISVFDITKTNNKLGVWFFMMPSTTEHTGDCFLLRSPEGKTMLIDSGNPLGGKLVCGYLDKLGVKKIDIMVITHMHVDHVGGSTSILNHVDVGEVYGTPLHNYNTSFVRNFKNSLRNKNITYKELKRGDNLQLGSSVSIETLWPKKDFSIPSNVIPEKDMNFTNNSSVVLRIQHGSNSFLFTGDIELDVERQLIDEIPEKLKVDVIKVPHHGAATSSTMDFIKALNARYGVISIFAFNDINVLNRYKANNVETFITSVDGNVLFLSDGKTLQYALEKA